MEIELIQTLKVTEQLFDFSSNKKIDFSIKLALSVLLLCLLGPVVITMKGELPITLQTLIILFISILFRWQIGFFAVLIYILTGALGLPVFAGYRGGVSSILGNSTGFFFGFIAASVITGYLAGLEAFRKPIANIMLWFLGHLIILLFGFIWLMQLNPQWKQMLADAMPGALIKSATGALLYQLTQRIFRGRHSYYNTK